MFRLNARKKEIYETTKKKWFATSLSHKIVARIKNGGKGNPYSLQVNIWDE